MRDLTIQALLDELRGGLPLAIRESKQIENSLDNPLQSIFGMSASVDVQVKQIIDRIVKSFFRKNASLIHQAMRSKMQNQDLHY